MNLWTHGSFFTRQILLFPAFAEASRQGSIVGPNKVEFNSSACLSATDHDYMLITL